MEKMRVFSLVLLTILSMFFIPCTSFAEEEGSKVASQEVLATVGDQKITQADIDSKTSLMPPQFRARYETPEGKQKLLDQIVKFSLLSQEARRLGIDKKEDVAQKIKEIADNLIITELTKQEITDKITITDEEIAKYYKENKKDYIKPEKVKVSLIHFEVKEDDAAEIKEEKSKKAQDALKRLKAGEDFATLAKELSEDNRTKKRGGNTGFFSKGKRTNTYGQLFEDKAFSKVISFCI